jgi:transcriptional regulator with XRE-family HTH domain
LPQYVPIEDARRARGLTQQQLAAAAGLARPTVNRIERGHVLPTASSAERLGQVLGGAMVAVIAPHNDDEAPARAPRVTDRPKRAAARATG